MTSEFGIAVHALVFLNHKGTISSSEEISKNICTNPARVRKVLSSLKKAGLIQTKEGVDGGYLFKKNPKTVTLEQVGKAIHAKFVSSSWRSGDIEMDCLVASGMADVLDTVYTGLNQLCYNHLAKQTIADIDKQLFKEKHEANP